MEKIKTEENYVKVSTSCEHRDMELDVSNMAFNPLRALYAKDYKVSTSKPKVVYQNVAAFESAFKKFGILKLNKSINQVKTDDVQTQNSELCTKAVQSHNPSLAPIDPETRFITHQYPIQDPTKLKQRHKRNIYMQISSHCGPLSRLQEYIKTHIRVRVNLRTNKGVQGFVEGQLKVFDKHWNMVLTEAIETKKRRKYKFGENKISGSPDDCRNRLQALGITLPIQVVKSVNRKNVMITRHLSHIFVRGEHVVLVSLL